MYASDQMKMESNTYLSLEIDNASSLIHLVENLAQIWAVHILSNHSLQTGPFGVTAHLSLEAFKFCPTYYMAKLLRWSIKLLRTFFLSSWLYFLTKQCLRMIMVLAKSEVVSQCVNCRPSISHWYHRSLLDFQSFYQKMMSWFSSWGKIKVRFDL